MVGLVGVPVPAAGDFSLEVEAAFCPVTKAIQLDARPIPVVAPTVKGCE